MDPKESLRRFYENVGEKYPEEDEVYNTLRGRLRRRFIGDFLRNWQGALLDVGCNRGMYLAGYSGGARFGVDLSRSVLKKAPKNANLRLAVADAENLACFLENSFNHVLCSEVLEHCLNPEAIFKGVASVLAPGGVALLTTPNHKGEKPEWIDLGQLKHFGVESDCEDGYFHTAYRPEELSAFAQDAGLKILDCGTFEKQVKYAAKVPAAVLLFGRLLNKLFRSEAFDRMNDRFFNRFCLAVNAFCRITKLEKILLKFVQEGVRSYILMQKPEREGK